ncbi:Acyl-protein thioesterase 1 [Symbiodinium microadriaticum]|uniref:Acyl-protein thioesterase 1 n=1 Tax=Symbiodinium microadriaticum TaxID=2951 RepID=A0A1Q9EUU4_SYMMI|nr:Acyl-protein thioesterase 1 [Symbiodinium microadriaticum]
MIPTSLVVLPTAPRRPITCYKGEMQHAWHDYITDHEGEREDELSAEDLQQTTERVHKMLDAEAALVGARNVYLGGASQGCGTALFNGLDDELMRWDVWVKATYERLAAAGAEVKMVVDEGVDHGEEEDKWIRGQEAKEEGEVRGDMRMKMKMKLYLLQTLLDQERVRLNIGRFELIKNVKGYSAELEVPAQMLAPHAGQRYGSLVFESQAARKPLPGDVASLLRINRHEARVLSSKARAPYMVMMEATGKCAQVLR